jgi:translation initiation factor 1 (eIF-1/SUI1)
MKEPAEKKQWFEVFGTKKGQLPVREEKRPKGKFVTVIFNVRGKVTHVHARTTTFALRAGKRDALLTNLQQTLGVGGSVQDGLVELQGKHQHDVERWLRYHNIR